jgi:hypothetical protein
MNRILKIFISWKFGLFLFVFIIFQTVLNEEWHNIGIRISPDYYKTKWLSVAENDIFIPKGIVVERIDYFEDTDNINAIFLKSADCIIIVSGIKNYDEDYWDKFLERLFSKPEITMAPEENSIYALNIHGDTAFAYHFQDFDNKGFSSENIFFFDQEVFFLFYGRDMNIEKAMSYVRMMFYYNIEKDFNWDYIRVTDIEDLKL